MGHPLTEEQRAALDLFMAGDSMVIDALAGTGKTSTLIALASVTRRRGRYMAFNRSIVEDVAGRLPMRCDASTVHSLGFKAIGHKFKRRLDAPRPHGQTVAAHLGLRSFVCNYGTQRKTKSPGWQAGHVARALINFCQGTDPEPTIHHFPFIDGLDPPGEARNNIALAQSLEGALGKAWVDIQQPSGFMRFTHDHYIKMWYLSGPHIATDYILYDEAQDANPVFAAIVGAQDHAQRTYVGDENQAIYGFTGAINAMAGFDAEQRRSLTRSFRFGPAIADRANKVLDGLDATLRVEGTSSIPSVVGPLVGQPDVVLCRTNAKVLETAFRIMLAGSPAHIMGGGVEIEQFARGAAELKKEGWTPYYELSCFSSWGEVQEYVRDDPQGSELALMTRLVDDFGTEKILDTIARTSAEAPGVVTVSTAHKAKGREWDRVEIASDMVDVDANEDELRLRYVAFTRARTHLDDSAFYDPANYEAGVVPPNPDEMVDTDEQWTLDLRR